MAHMVCSFWGVVVNQVRCHLVSMMVMIRLVLDCASAVHCSMVYFYGGKVIIGCALGNKYKRFIYNAKTNLLPEYGTKYYLSCTFLV